MAFNEVKTGDLYTWDEPSDDVDLQGILNAYSQEETSKGMADRYEVETADGIVPFFAPTILHDKLQRIDMGQVVKITYTEKDTTNSGNDLKQFKVLEADPTDENLEEVGLDPDEVGDNGDEFDEVTDEDVPDDF